MNQKSNLELYLLTKNFIKNKRGMNDDKLIRLDNALSNKLKEKTKCDNKCFFDNVNCSNNGKAIGSHLIQKKRSTETNFTRR